MTYTMRWDLNETKRWDLNEMKIEYYMAFQCGTVSCWSPLYSHHPYFTDQSSLIPQDPWWLAAGCRLWSNQFALARGRGPNGIRGYLRTFNGIHQQWRVEYFTHYSYGKDNIATLYKMLHKIPWWSGPLKLALCQHDGLRCLGINVYFGMTQTCHCYITIILWRHRFCI